MRMKLFAAACCVSLLPLTGALAAPLGITQLVVFGDSLSDTGNAAFGLGGTIPGNYAPTEFTDGPATNPATTGPQGIWVDQIAPKLGIAVPKPGFAVPGGTDFAVGSAQTGVNASFPGPLQAPYVTQQVGAYLAGSVPSSRASFWAGANDIANLRIPDSGRQHLQQHPGFVPGGRKEFPVVRYAASRRYSGRDCARSPVRVRGNAAAAAFNTEWSTDIGKLMNLGINVIGVDTASLAGSNRTLIAAAPWAQQIRTASRHHRRRQGKNVESEQLLSGRASTPSTAGKLIADLAYSDIVGTPEPASFALGFLGIAGVALLRMRRNRT